MVNILPLRITIHISFLYSPVCNKIKTQLFQNKTAPAFPIFINIQTGLTGNRRNTILPVLFNIFEVDRTTVIPTLVIGNSIFANRLFDSIA